ncbi:MAG TPA: histidine phosphatase family protein [Armatimonadota bacterium]
MRIIFVRHGQTVYNNESRYQGQADTVLSDLGRRQAALVAERLKYEDISAVYASDLCRAVETAEAAAAYHNMKVVCDIDLREVGFGEWEGLTVGEIKERYPEIYANYQRDSLKNRAPGGERLEELQVRSVRAVEAIAARHPKETVLIVAHGGPIKAFICHALETGLETFRRLALDNGGITVFSMQPDGRWFLEVLNDSCHVRSGNPAVAGHDETLVTEKSL